MEKEFDNKKTILTFGLTEKNLEVINKYKNRWEDAEFDRDTWIRVGEEIGWEALTACLWYFRFNHKEQPVEQLETRIKELEEEKTTETKIQIQQIKKLNFHIEKTVCCNFVVRKNFNYCPNCGRKIKK